MSGFDPNWLALREPADHASINAFLRLQLIEHFRDEGHIEIVDLGCGTGSNLRGLSPWFPQPQSWQLVDNDPALLAIAGRQDPALGRPVDRKVVQADLACSDPAEFVEGADLVTASAFFDLASPGFVDRLARATAATGAVFYTALTYDGIASWIPEHPADADMRRLFNQHQRNDKGLGPALGPTATDALHAAFEALGYRVLRGPSPWVLTERHSALRKALDAGWSDAVAETGTVDPTVVAAWRQHRLECADAVTIIGHEDLLALPSGV